MKVGARDRRQVVAACVLTALAVFVLAHCIFRWESSANNVRGVASISFSKAPSGKPRANQFDPLDPTLHFSRLALTEHEAYEGSGRNIFAPHGDDQPENTAPQPRPVPVPPSTPGAAPTIALKFFGIAMISGLPRRACLSEAGDIFIGGEGDIVDRRYKLLGIGTYTVEVQDLLANDQYTLRLER